MKPFHPLTFWALSSALIVGVILSNNIYWAAASVGGMAIVVHLKNETGPWRKSFTWSLLAGLYLIVIRAIAGITIGVPRLGHVLFTLPQLHLPQWMPGIRIGGDVTWERLSFSLHEGVIIAAVIALFGAANSLTSPHKLLRILPSGIYHLGITLTIATSVFPQLINSISRIRQAQYLRSGRRPKFSSVAIPLLEESLGRAVALAESMESRGFGHSTQHSRYRPIRYSLRDLTLIASGIVLAGLMVAM